MTPDSPLYIADFENFRIRRAAQTEFLDFGKVEFRDAYSRPEDDIVIQVFVSE